MKKVKRLKNTIIILILVAVVATWLLVPRPIADSGIEEVVRVQANFNYGDDKSELEDIHFSPDKIIECISGYKQRISLTKHNGYAMKNVQISIVIRTNNGLKEIVIGKDTYCHDGSGFEYKIKDEKSFKKDIFDAVGYADSKQNNKGTTYQFAFNDLQIEVTNVGKTKTKTASDGFQSWEYAVYEVYNGAEVRVKNADMFYDDSQTLHPSWAFYTEDEKRIDIVNNMKPLKITSDIKGIYDTESSVYILMFERAE